MNILAFDTAHAICSVALKRGEEIYALDERESRQQGLYLLPSIDRLLKEANLSLRDLHAIALGIGPGSFTGLRVGCSAAKAIGLAYNLPIIKLSSLQLLAETAYQLHGYNQIFVANMAKQNHYYCAEYKLLSGNNHLTLVGKESLIKIEQNDQKGSSDALTAGSSIVGVGNGWGTHSLSLQKYFNISDRSINLMNSLLPSVKTAFNLANFFYKKGEIAHASHLLPHYLYDMSDTF